MSDKKDGAWVNIAKYSGAAMILPASTVVGYGMGYGLDYFFSTHYLRIVFLILGTIGGFIELIRTLTKE